MLGAGHRIEYDLAGATMPANVWHSLQVPLSAPGWKHLSTQLGVSAAEFAAIMGSLTAVRIRGEWSTGPDVDDLDNVVMTVANADPQCDRVVAAPVTLWPPNHTFRTISLAGASDPDGDPVSLTVAGVTQDEPVSGIGDGDTAPDARSSDVPGAVDVRVERAGRGDGRVYRIAFSVTDGNGGSCTGEAAVGVPHDRRPGSVAVDSGGAVDSFGT